MHDMQGLKSYKIKADNLVREIMLNYDFDEKELVILAAAMTISQFTPTDIIAEEFNSAKDYLTKYKRTGDKDYLMFAVQELEHGRKPLAELKARLHHASTAENERYNEMHDLYEKLRKEIAEAQA